MRTRILPADAPLAKKEAIRIDDLAGVPLFASAQGWEGDIRAWAGDRFPELHLEGSFRLAYNASMFVREGLGYQLTFRHLVDVSPESGLVFSPAHFSWMAPKTRAAYIAAIATKRAIRMRLSFLLMAVFIIVYIQ